MHAAALLPWVPLPLGSHSTAEQSLSAEEPWTEPYAQGQIWRSMHATGREVRARKAQSEGTLHVP